MDIEEERGARPIHVFVGHHLITCSCIVNEAKKVYRMTQSTLGERGESSFEDRNIVVSHHGGRSASRPSANEILGACCNRIFGRIPDEQALKSSHADCSTILHFFPNDRV